MLTNIISSANIQGMAKSMLIYNVVESRVGERRCMERGMLVALAELKHERYV